MKRLAIAALSVIALGVAIAWTQQVLPPSDTINCAYNSSPPPVTSGQMVRVQCDSTGKIITSGGGGGGGAVTIADGADVAEGTTTDAACATDNGTCTVNAVLKRIAQRLTTLITNITNTIILQSGENHIGEVGGNILPITVAVTTTASATIASGDSIGGIQTFTNAVRVSGSLGASGTSGIIQDGVITWADAALSGSAVDIYFFNAALTTSTCTNDTAFALTAVDYGKVIGIAHVTDQTATTAATAPITAQFGNLAKSFGLASSTTLRACIVLRSPASLTTTANSNTQFMLTILRQ